MIGLFLFGPFWFSRLLIRHYSFFKYILIYLESSCEAPGIFVLNKLPTGDIFSTSPYDTSSKIRAHYNQVASLIEISEEKQGNGSGGFHNFGDCWRV